MSRAVAWAVAITAMLTMAVSYADRQTLAALAPSVTKDLHISETEYGWLGSLFSFAYLFATPLGGWWIDRVGARRGLVRSLLVWSGIAALHALAPGLGMLLVLRAMLGLAEGPGFSGAAQTAHRVLPAAERARGFGVLFMGSSLGSMVAPLLASTLYEYAGGWRVAFLGTAAIGLLWLVPWIALTRRPEVRAALDARPPVAPRAGWLELRELLAHPVMVRALVAVFAAAPLIGFVLLWGAKLLARTYGIAQEEVGHYLWLPPLVFDAGAFVFGDLASRLPRAPGAPPRALVATAMTIAATLALAPLTRTAWQLTGLLAFAMAGGGALYTLITADLLSRVPEHRVSLASGVMACAQSLALILAGPLIGGSVDRRGDYVAVTIALGVWVLPGSLAWLAWKPRRFAAGSSSTP
jgi:ACS family hexuronate transporter-like MFS transporter